VAAVSACENLCCRISGSARGSDRPGRTGRRTARELDEGKGTAARGRGHRQTGLEGRGGWGATVSYWNHQQEEAERGGKKQKKSRTHGCVRWAMRRWLAQVGNTYYLGYAILHPRCRIRSSTQTIEPNRSPTQPRAPPTADLRTRPANPTRWSDLSTRSPESPNSLSPFLPELFRGGGGKSGAAAAVASIDDGSGSTNPLPPPTPLDP
jgi:hypothetical protein